MKPRYKHGCPNCVFVADIAPTERDGVGGRHFDGYFCASHHGGEAIVLRVGQSGDYGSGYIRRGRWGELRSGDIWSHPDAYAKLLAACVDAGLVDKRMVDAMQWQRED
jgi:hypothetical protein